jgi:hypothetical protein
MTSSLKSFFSRQNTCVWKCFSALWIVFVLPVKWFETQVVSKTLARIAYQLKMEWYSVASGLLMGAMVQTVIVRMIQIFSPSAACSVFMTCVLWVLSHIVVRSFVIKLMPRGKLRKLRWDTDGSATALWPCGVPGYTGLCIAFVLGYTWFTVPPDETPFMQWCSLVPGWHDLPEGMLFSFTVVFACFSALVHVEFPSRRKRRQLRVRQSTQFHQIREDSSDDETAVGQLAAWQKSALAGPLDTSDSAWHDDSVDLSIDESEGEEEL